MFDKLSAYLKKPKTVNVEAPQDKLPSLPHLKENLPGSKVPITMHEFGQGNLHSGSDKGPIVKNPKQAIAIALSQERKRQAGKL